MSVLYGVQGLATTLAHQACADALQAMGRRAAASVGASPAVQALSGEGHAMALCARRRTDEAIVSPFARRGPLTLALRGRVDERAMLLRQLGLAADAPLSDAQLLLEAWEPLRPPGAPLARMETDSTSAGAWTVCTPPQWHNMNES